MANDLSMFTPTQRKMLKMLSDGLPHSRAELLTCLPDPMQPPTVVRRYVSEMRRLLRMRGQSIICELVNRRICYRHVRLLVSPNDGLQ